MAGKQLTHLTDENFQQTVSKGVTLVDFHAAWCGPCRMMTPIIEQLASKVPGKATIAKLDIEEAPKITEELQITFVPTLMIFKDGKEVWRDSGVKDEAFLMNKLQSFV